MNKEQIFRSEVLKAVEKYHRYKNEISDDKSNKISYGGRVYDEQEMIKLVDSALDFWLTTGRYSEQFEKDFAKFLKVKYCSLTNSGSSAFSVRKVSEESLPDILNPGTYVW